MDLESVVDSDSGIIGCTDNVKVIRLKKSQKKAKKIEEYREKKKELRPKKRRERRKMEAKIRHEMLAAMTIEERRKFILNERNQIMLLQIKIEENLIKSFNSGVKICINCGFEDRMSAKEINSLAKQITMVYGQIKKSMYNMQLHLSNFKEDGPLAEQLKKFSYEKWMIHKHKEDYWRIYNPKSIIIMSPDGEEDLEEVLADKVYIIGGLVDVNNLKNETRIQSITLGLECKKLPLQIYPECKKKVLTIPAVVNILAARLDGMTWEKAFHQFIPKNRLHRSPNQ